MTTRPRLSTAVLLLFSALLCPLAAPAQTVTPVPHLDFDRMRTTWHVQARYPIRKQKLCTSNEVVLYALYDKKNSFQMVTECRIKQDVTTWWFQSGKLDPHGTGALGITHWFIFHRKYWVLAVAPDYNWAIVGTPNKKSLWLLTTAATPDPTVVTSMKSQASTMGFNTSKLKVIPYVPPQVRNQPPPPPPGARGPSVPPAQQQ